MNVLSVSSLNEQIKTLLESSFVRVFVEGELSRITYHNSGHIYFTLKDSSSTVRCVMFRGNAAKLKFHLEEGLKVLIEGALSVYKPRGEYQINCFMIEPSGQGALALAYEQLKCKLSEKGYFDQEAKKQLPRFPRRIALITSATGAALQDMLRVANQRYKLLEIDIYDVLVQGDSSAASIVKALKTSDSMGYDVIVVGRGGGSMEDLWSFNEEIVADAIFEAKTPVISAVGHEIDWLISDFVADLRAPTPSAAMQMLLPDTNELYQTIDTIMQNYDTAISTKIYNWSRAIEHQTRLYEQNSIEQKIMQKQEEILRLKTMFFQNIELKLQRFQQQLEPWQDKMHDQLKNLLAKKQHQLDSLKENMELNNPSKKAVQGYGQISQKGKVIDIDTLHVDDMFEVMSSEKIIFSKVIDIKPITLL
jgi:exodeoxyribonuclease VII large subunit